jgi:NAD(P)H-hydrate epimerase
MKLVTASQMREMDRRASEEFGVSGLELMERAGIAVFLIGREMLGARKRVLVLCGKGNNGGDGFVAARLLRREGYPVQVWLASSVDSLRGDAKVNYERAVRSGVPIRESATASSPLPDADLIIDALLGTGLASEVREPVRSLIEAANASGRPILAVDLPSGLNSDTGRVCGVSIRAAKTVTFALPKIGMAQYPGMKLVGELIVGDIGMPEPLLEDAALNVERATAETTRKRLPSSEAATNKGARGKLLVIAGAEGFTGAACLSSEAALRAGSGLVYLACPQSLNDIYEIKLTEVITRPVPEPLDRRCFGAESVDAVAGELEKVDAVVLGPGLSRNSRTDAFFAALVPRIQTPCLIDADGLNLLSDRPDLKLPEQCVLTPHPGEMARLLRCEISDVQADRIGAARRAAERFRATALLKGPGTAVAAPDGRVSLNPTGTPALATAGTGDVLSGIIGALLGRGLDPFDAAAAGAYLHGLAGEIAEETYGEEGVIAGDLATRIPLAFRRVRDPNNCDLRQI